MTTALGRNTLAQSATHRLRELRGSLRFRFPQSRKPLARRSGDNYVAFARWPNAFDVSNDDVRVEIAYVSLCRAAILLDRYPNFKPFALEGVAQESSTRE